MKHWHKEPLLHFLIIGVAIFAVFSIANKEEAAVGGNKIVVSSAETERLSDAWSKRMNRPPLKNQLYCQESNGIFLNVIDFSGLGDQGYGIGVTVGDIDNVGVLICW